MPQDSAATFLAKPADAAHGWHPQDAALAAVRASGISLHLLDSTIEAANLRLAKRRLVLGLPAADRSGVIWRGRLWKPNHDYNGGFRRLYLSMGTFSGRSHDCRLDSHVINVPDEGVFVNIQEPESPRIIYREIRFGRQERRQAGLRPGS
jgi:hypothetical protein